MSKELLPHEVAEIEKRAEELYPGKEKKAGMNGVVTREKRKSYIAASIYERQRAKTMDAELNIVHECLTELYNLNINEVNEKVKTYLDKIKKLQP